MKNLPTLRNDSSFAVQFSISVSKTRAILLFKIKIKLIEVLMPGMWSGINGRSIQTLLRGENDSKQSDKFQASLPVCFLTFSKRWGIECTSSQGVSKVRFVQARRSHCLSSSSVLGAGSLYVVSSTIIQMVSRGVTSHEFAGWSSFGKKLAEGKAHLLEFYGVRHLRDWNMAQFESQCQ